MLATYDVVDLEGAVRPLADLCGPSGIVDFWTMRCARCPAALTQLGREAPGAPTTIVACVLSTRPSNEDFDEWLDFMDDRPWPNLAHAFMDFETKERAKRELGFSHVPFQAKNC